MLINSQHRGSAVGMSSRVCSSKIVFSAWHRSLTANWHCGSHLVNEFQTFWAAMHSHRTLRVTTATWQDYDATHISGPAGLRVSSMMHSRDVRCRKGQRGRKLCNYW